jgi:type I restriction enzyme, S subunit
MSKISPTVPLEQLCDPDRGITYGIVKVGDFIPGGVPVIRGGDIRDGRIVFDDHKRVTEEVSNKFRRTILRGGELLINLIAEPGHVAIVPKNLAGSNVSRDVAVIALNDSVDHRFVCYLLKSPDCVQWLTSRLQGSVTQKINLNTLREVPVPLLPLCQQKAIAHILGTLDDKIELNREMNQTLEAIAQAIFKSWFVDFDPVRAKMEGRQPAGMDAATAELFPDEFEESALGMIPKEWRVGTIETECRLIMGQSPKSEFYNTTGDGLPFHQGVTNFGVRFPIHKNFCSVSERIANKGDILFSVRAPVGRINIADRKLIIGRGLSAIRHNQNYQSFLLYYLMHTFKEEDSIGTGTIFASVTRKDIQEVKLIVPSNKIVNIFDSQVQVVDDKIANNEEESRTLASIRDTLLPKLLSGEIRVKEAEKIAAKTM